MACVNGEFYHIVNRGVDGRHIFNTSSDYCRFKKGLLSFNTNDAVDLRWVSESAYIEKRSDLQQDRIVDVVAYCLMKNHFHLLVRQRAKKGVEQYLRKLIGGYTKYFNLKNKRKGVLFQSTSKIIHIDDGVYLNYISLYVILNSIDYIDKRWREHGVKNTRLIKKKLLEYPHSSLHGILDAKVDPILSHKLINEIIDRKDFMDCLLSWSSDDFVGGNNVFVEP